jgi:omega-6 fatty acid desaturase (delta-12 desaturase)
MGLIWIAIANLRFVTAWDGVIAVLLGVGLVLFDLRLFVLMHDCGHDSLFRSRRGNRAMGFVFGVLAGMPQMVWARHHRYHDQTNGNWARYRGPLNVISVADYQALTPAARWRYRLTRSIWLAPLAGFHYLVN